MYQPGGARLPLAGACTVRPPAAEANVRGTRRAFSSKPWVTAAGATRTAELIRAASGVDTAMAPP